MRTLCLRNVPDDVVRRLQLLADRDGTSVGSVAVRELADVSRRADNAALLGARIWGSPPTRSPAPWTRSAAPGDLPVIVLDASAALAGLLGDGPARVAMDQHQLHCPDRRLGAAPGLRCAVTVVPG